MNEVFARQTSKSKKTLERNLSSTSSLSLWEGRCIVQRIGLTAQLEVRRALNRERNARRCDAYRGAGGGGGPGVATETRSQLSFCAILGTLLSTLSRLAKRYVVRPAGREQRLKQAQRR